LPSLEIVTFCQRIWESLSTRCFDCDVIRRSNETVIKIEDDKLLILHLLYSIKKPKTFRYPSLKGTDPKFRRNHRHALHGTMKALVCGR